MENDIKNISDAKMFLGNENITLKNIMFVSFY